jgi:hypothetical protein
MRFAGLPLGLAAVCACAVLTAGCGAAAKPGGSAAGIVPASVPVYVAVDTDTGSSQWQTIDDLASRFPDKQKAIDALKEDLRKQNGIDYEQDVKPALGSELDIVWLDLAGNGDHVVGLTQPGDDEAFKRLVEKGNAKAGSTKLHYQKVGDWEVFADKQALVDRFVIESGGGGAKLGDDPGFQRAMDSVSEDSLVKAYVSGPGVMDELTKRAGPDAAKQFEQLGTLDWITAALRASSDGIRFDTVVRGTPGKLLQNAYSSSGFHASLPERVPGDALFYLGFHGAAGMLDKLGSTPQFSAPQLGPAAGILRDVGALLEGEDALYARKPAAGRIPEVTLVTEPKAGTDGVAVLDGVFQKYRSQLSVQPETASFGGVEGRKLDFGPFQLDYANVGGKFVVTDLPQGIESLGSPSSTLAQSDTFKGAADASGLPAQTQGFVYVDIQGGVGLVQKLAHSPIPESVARNLKPLRSAVEYALTQPSEAHVTFFLQIK